MERLFNLDAQLLFDACVMALSMLVMFTFLSYLLFKPVENFWRTESRELLMNRSQQRMTGKRQPFTKKNTNRN